MVRRIPPRLTSRRAAASAALGLALWLASAGAAHAAKPSAKPAPAPAPVEPVGAAPAGGEMPEPTVTDTPVTTAPEPSPVAGTLAASPTRAPDVSYGVGARLRWVSVPKWLLNVFTKKNVPLSSYSVAGEFYRRKGEFDFMVSIGYTNLSPNDGNWLGRSHDASVDTDYVQFDGLGLVGIDASFIWHTFFNDWFGIHYGAGLGIGVVTGHILRTSNGSGCTEANAGDVTKCHPIGAGVDCSSGTCTGLGALGSGADDPGNPHRFTDPNVPPALPIVNVLVGIDFRLPQVRGWEAKLEGGFADVFFLGGGVGYTF